MLRKDKEDTIYVLLATTDLSYELPISIDTILKAVKVTSYDLIIDGFLGKARTRFLQVLY